MNLTYNEILDTMRKTFCDEAGEDVKGLSDLEARFKAVASEIYSVSTYGDYILKQSFPQTATGKYLDKHASLRSIERKSASLASGIIYIYRTENSLGTSSISIPKGTVFSVADSPFIQFCTEKTYTLGANSASGAITVYAMKAGDEYNISAGTQLIIVNPPAYLESATAKSNFKGGCNEESDEALRERILSSYSSRKNAVSVNAVRETLLTIDDITDASLSADEDHVLNVCLKTKSSQISSALKADVLDMLGFAVICGVKLNYISATKQAFGVTAEAKIMSGYSRDEIESEIRQRITEFCSSEKIGHNYTESAIASYCSGIDGVEYINIFLGTSNVGATSCKSTSYLKLEDIEVFLHE